MNQWTNKQLGKVWYQSQLKKEWWETKDTPIHLDDIRCIDMTKITVYLEKLTWR